MEKIFATSFNLGNIGEKIDIQDVIKTVTSWIQHPRRPIFTQEEIAPISHENLSIQRQNAFLKTILTPNDKGQSFGVNFQHGGESSGDFWRTRLAFQEKNGIIQSSCRLDYGVNRYDVRPRKITLTKPGIINLLMEKHNAHDGIIPLSSSPIFASTEDIKGFSNYLMGRGIERTHPLVFVSQKWENSIKGTSLVNIKTLSKKVAGLANVVVENSRGFSFEIRDKNLIPSYLRCYGGAIRIYWPNAETTSSYDNFCWSPAAIQEIEEEEKENSRYRKRDPEPATKVIFEYLVNILKQAHIPEDLTFEGIVNQAQRERITTLRSSLESKMQDTSDSEKVEELNELVDLLDRDNQQLQMTIDEQAIKEEELSKTITDKTQRIFQFEKQQNRKKEKAPSLNIEIPDFYTLRDVVINAQAHTNGKLFIPEQVLNSRDFKQSSGFRNHEFIQKALIWLGGEYLEHLNTGGSFACEQELNESFRKFCGGGFYSGHQPQLIKKTYKDTYKFTFKNIEYDISRHIGLGTEKNPTKTIRVAFAPIQTVANIYNSTLIGYIGTHQKTRDSK